MQIKQIEESDKQWVIRLFRKSWGSEKIVTKGKIIDASELPGFIAAEEDNPVGLITYKINNNECEIVTLDSLLEGKGIGTNLIHKVLEEAKKKGCKRVWTITTNDNTHAQDFYKKRGFQIVAVYKNAIEKSRKLKPEIPMIGMNGIPIADEIEFEFNNETNSVFKDLNK